MPRGIILSAIFAIFLTIVSGCSKERERPAETQEPGRADSQAAAPTAASPSKPIQANGTIVGKVVFKGSYSAGKLTVGKDREVCGNSKRDPSLLVGANGGINNAVVQIGGVRQGRTPNQEPVLDQTKCDYDPHVLVIAPGTTVRIKNSDAILHNVHTVSQINPPFNRAQPKFMKEIKETFAKPEIIAVRCDVHGWMSGWIIVTENVFFDVTQSDGGFRLDDVPAGKYTLEVWHETLGSATQPVQLKAGETLNVTFEFQKK